MCTCVEISHIANGVKKKKGKKKPWIREALDKSVRAELKY